MEWENEKRKDGIYNTWCFSVFPFFILQKKKTNKNRYEGSYFCLPCFVFGFGNRKRMHSYPFSIFYHEINKKKTRGKYIYMDSIFRANCLYKLSVLKQRTWKLLLWLFVVQLHQNCANTGHAPHVPLTILLTIMLTMVHTGMKSDWTKKTQK